MNQIQQKRRVLFICSYNRLRSPTAQKIFSDYTYLEVKSAGILPHAIIQVSKELLEWADIIFVMESTQKRFILDKFNGISNRKSIICLNIPDEYYYMDSELVEMLRDKVSPYIAGEEGELS